MFCLVDLSVLGLSERLCNLLAEIHEQTGLSALLNFQNAQGLHLGSGEEYARFQCRNKEVSQAICQWVNTTWVFDPKKPGIPVAFTSGLLEYSGITIRCCDSTVRKGES